MSQRVRHAISINAPVEKVFDYLDTPENSLALIPQLVEVKEITPLANGGHRIRFVALGVNHAAIRFALRVGLRLAAYSHLLTTAPFGQMEKYLPSGPSLF